MTVWQFSCKQLNKTLTKSSVICVLWLMICYPIRSYVKDLKYLGWLLNERCYSFGAHNLVSPHHTKFIVDSAVKELRSLDIDSKGWWSCCATGWWHKSVSPAVKWLQLQWLRHRDIWWNVRVIVERYDSMIISRYPKTAQDYYLYVGTSFCMFM